MKPKDILPEDEDLEEMDRVWEQECFGCSAKNLDRMIESSFSRDNKMLAMSILSDAQEELENGNIRIARQFINRAKYVISHNPKPTLPITL